MKEDRPADVKDRKERERESATKETNRHKMKERQTHSERKKDQQMSRIEKRKRESLYLENNFTYTIFE